MTAPVTKAIRVPTTEGKDALDFLEAHGVVPSTPTLRSSDFGTLMSNPLIYLLSRRFGITPALSYSKALSRGSFFHIPFAVYDHPSRWIIYDKAVETRVGELTGTCQKLGMDNENIASCVERERIDAAEAKSWFMATETVKIGSPNQRWRTVQEWMRQPRFRKLGGELTLTYVHPEFPKAPCVLTIDVLLYDVDAHVIYIVDAKTCDCSPLVRASICKEEFQTQHYMMTVQRLLDYIIDTFKLHKDTRLGGMVHVIIRKPSIKLSGKDRDYHWISMGKRKNVKGYIRPHTTGGFATQWENMDDPDIGGSAIFEELEGAIETLHQETGKKPEKAYYGEPRIENFIARCADQYHGRGDYAAEAERRQDDPWVNRHMTSAAILKDGRWKARYWRRLQMLYDAATRSAYPKLFESSPYSCIKYGQLTAYAPFVLLPVEQWPGIMEQDNFIIARRDDDMEIGVDPESFIDYPADYEL
jgi:hypothetical protein